MGMYFQHLGGSSKGVKEFQTILSYTASSVQGYMRPYLYKTRRKSSTVLAFPLSKSELAYLFAKRKRNEPT